MKGIYPLPSSKQQCGFTMIEVLIAMLILAIGILGAGAMQTVGLQNSIVAYTRSQAMFIAGDVVDRMRGNRAGLALYDGFDTQGAVPGLVACLTSTGGCSPALLATADQAQLIGYVAPATPGPAGLLPGGRIIIRQNPTNVFTVTVSWSERDYDNSSSYSQKDNQAKSYSVTVNLTPPPPP